MVLYVIIFLIGVLFGVLLLSLFHQSIGAFLIDDSDENKTKWTLQVDGDPDNIRKKKYVTFKVYIEN